MPLTVYMDVHVPEAITEALRRRSIDVLTSQEDGTRESSDDMLFQRAVDLGRLLFTQDEDFLTIAAEWQQYGRAFPGVVYAHQDQTAIGRTIDDLELLLTCSEADELENRVVYLPLR